MKKNILPNNYSILKLLAIVCSSLVGVSLNSCASATIDPQAEYVTTKPLLNSSLTLPPGLTSPDNSAGYKMLDIHQDGYLLDKIKDMQIVQGGSERWLIVKNKSVNQVWPMMLAFINQQGLDIKIQNANIGLIQTDWATRNTTVKEQGGARALFDWMGLGSMYSLQSQYMYRVNLWQNESDTLVFVTDYQMDEVYPSCASNLNQTIKVQPSDTQATKWMPIPPNPQIQLGFLVQFMAFVGFSPTQTQQVILATKKAESDIGEAQLKSTTLIINDHFDRAWWRVGIALERSQLGIADRNRSLGEYYVYPLQSEVDNPTPGFFSRLFGEDKNKLSIPKPRYTVKLEQSTSQTTLTLTAYPATEDKDFIKHQQKYLGALLLQLK